MACVEHKQTADFKSNLVSLTMGGHVLSKDDNKRVKHAYYLLGQLILDMVPIVRLYYGDELGQTYSRNCSPRAVRNWVQRLCRLDVSDVFTDFKAALQALRHLSDNERAHYATVYDDGVRAYVRAWGVSTSGEVWRMIAPFFRLVWLTDEARAFKMVNDILQFICRLTLSDVDWIEEENIAAYKDFEEKLKTQSYDPGLLRELRSIVTDWFRDFDWSQAVGQHGYGATSEVKRSAGTAKKYQNMIPTVETARLTQLLGWTPQNHVWPSLRLRQASMLSRYENQQGRGLHASDLVCKVQLVPKGLDKKRVVSMEPTVHQFYQKMIGCAMSEHFDKHPEMRINLHNQELNRQLTVVGSKYRNYGTIDLSSASDSVTWTLVQELFKETPLFYPLMWCRTTKASLPDGSVVDLEKFNPMGSATCFPVECTVFSAIVSLANRHMGVNRYYRVYGDDIVCHRDVFEEVLRLLKALNFLVNEDKSFAPQLPFKESCGIEVYKGFDVSPLRISRKFDIVKAERTARILDDMHLLRPGRFVSNTGKAMSQCSPQLDSLYCLGNDAWIHGYHGLRKSIIRTTVDLFHCPMFSHNFEHGFFTPTANLSMRCVEKYDRDILQRKVKCLTISSEIDRGRDDLRFSKLIEEYDTTKREQLLLPDDRIETAVGAATTKYSWKWYLWDDLDRYPTD